MPLDAEDQRSIIGQNFLDDFGLSEKRPVGTPTTCESQRDRAASDDDVAGALFDDFRDASIRSEIASTKSERQQSRREASSLQSMFVRQDVLRSTTTRSLPGTVHDRLPQVGDEIFGFRLKQPLGQGAFARVFMAEQTELANRPVVIKTSDLTGSEPQTLALLQHTNIVPIYSVHEDEVADLRAVCMPYFGGASLSQVLKSVIETAERPQFGREIVEALDRVGSPMKTPVPQEESNLRATLRRLGYAEACCFIVARLAEGLQHAHDRGVLHRDIKPSNVLMTADGTPMLLDFNLSHDEQQSNQQVEATLGGTLAYMAPEHLRAINKRSSEMVKKVDQRSDIYGLGMVLFELVTGRSAFEQMASYAAVPLLVEAMANERARFTPSVRSLRLDASWGLESVLRKCLDPDPERRYQRAEQLADDLSRLIDSRPLKYAPELSRREQVDKWLKRHPRFVPSVSLGALSLLLLGIGGYALSATQSHLHAAQQRAFEAEGAEARELKSQFERGLQQALCLVNTHSTLQDHAERGAQICEETLALYGVLERDDWQQQSSWQRLSAAEQADVAEDSRELLLLLALARSQEADNGPQRALIALQRASKIPGLKPSAAVLQIEAKLLRETNQLALADEKDRAVAALHPETARDFYQLATTVLQSTQPDRHQRAIASLRAALKIDPRHYWSWMQKGLCHLELGEQHQALSDFGVCVGLAPEFAWGYFNRAFALDQIGDKAGAVDDYSNAIARDATLLAAYHNRGVARLEMRQFEPALTDFEQLLTGAAPDSKHKALPFKITPELHALRGQAFEGLARHTEADAAFAQAFADPAGLLPSVRHQMSCAYGFAVYRRLPEQAEHAFLSVNKNDPRFAEASYGLGMLATEQREEAAAIRHFKAAIAARPSFDEPRRFMAIVLARLGRIDEAVQAVNESLTLNPASGPSFYAAACVSALAAQRTSDTEQSRQAKLEALNFLTRALEHGYGQQAASDSDLSALHDLPEFQSLLKSPQ